MSLGENNLITNKFGQKKEPSLNRHKRRHPHVQADPRRIAANLEKERQEVAHRHAIAKRQADTHARAVARQEAAKGQVKPLTSKQLKQQTAIMNRLAERARRHEKYQERSSRNLVTA